MNFKLTGFILAGAMLLSLSSYAADESDPVTNAVLDESETEMLVWMLQHGLFEIPETF